MDPLIVETWLRLCDGMTDERGGMMLDDFNGDGVVDALFLPTIISDLGFGPGGAQGAVLLYHGRPKVATNLVYNPEVFGQPTLLTMATSTATAGSTWPGRSMAAPMTSASRRSRLISWNPEPGEYESIVEPGANIAEGQARFEDCRQAHPVRGKQLVLEGGVSGTPEGGLEVPHTEVWQSIGGQPFRRLSWTYDRATPRQRLAGLRLVEADMALQAADVLATGRRPISTSRRWTRRCGHVHLRGAGRRGVEAAAGAGHLPLDPDPGVERHDRDGAGNTRRPRPGAA